MQTTHYDNNDDNERSVRRAPHPFVPGYASVLVRMDRKDRLRQLRDALGLLRESQVERCLATALFDLALNDPSLQQRVRELYLAATEEDLRVSREPMPPRPQRSSPSPRSGAVERPASLDAIPSSEEK